MSKSTALDAAPQSKDTISEVPFLGSSSGGDALDSTRAQAYGPESQGQDNIFSSSLSIADSVPKLTLTETERGVGGLMSGSLGGVHHTEVAGDTGMESGVAKKGAENQSDLEQLERATAMGVLTKGEFGDKDAIAGASKNSVMDGVMAAASGDGPGLHHQDLLAEAKKAAGGHDSMMAMRDSMPEHEVRQAVANPHAIYAQDSIHDKSAWGA